ncbi:glycosyltransferase family 2 protein [Pseudomonas sp. KNUC1026]|uniref:glycosyltransferase family 2 protein n=1 Tax=Pseudomonas sp. KNUC1026 TaxID=2893890 RepID=UPI001F2E59AA|nr:glycosyltransferase [Pseudomonas sp. KNUC1026]UFH50567.1 glycosyltransferase [Pseudomonas sp. KNUC1026]
MQALIEHGHAWLNEIRGPNGDWRLFLMVFPYFLLLEVPMNLLVLVGILRWFTRVRSATPQHSPYLPRVSCVITCYGEGDAVALTLRSLAEQTYPGVIEIIPVIDGAAANGATTAAVRRFKRDARLPANRQVRPIAKWQRGGRVSTLNAGLAYSRGEVIINVDGDTSFDNDMVVRMVRHFQDPKVPAVAGSLRVRNASQSLVARIQALEYLLSIHMSKIGLSEFNLVNNVSGAFGAFRRSFLEHIGGWDTHTAEDLDLTLRIKSYFRKYGLRVPFEPQAIGHTDAPHTLKGFLQQRLRWDGDLYFVYMRKHPHAFNPRLVGWRNFGMLLVSGLFFQLVLPFIILGYSLVALLMLPFAAFAFYSLLIYGIYALLATLLYLGLIVMVSERQRQDLRLAWILPIYPLAMYGLRLWSVVAILNETLRRGHEESSMAPWWVLKRANRF